METMEEYKVVRIVNEEPEFCEGQRANAIVDYFILCEESKMLFGQKVYDLEICGMNLVNWVARACSSKPRVIKINGDEDVLNVIRPYVSSESDYSVVLYADTPLVNKAHILDLIEFIDRKRMNICKLKRGFVFKNDYIQYNDEFYSVDEYDFASDDFKVISDGTSLSEVKLSLQQRIIDFHKRNAVQFENENMVTIDANVQIGEFSKIAAGVSVVRGSRIDKNSFIGTNVKISGSTIGEKAKIGDNTLVVDSIVKDNVFVGVDCIVKNSVVGNNIIIEIGTKLVSSSLKDGVILKAFTIIDDGRIGESAIVHKHAKIKGLTQRVIVGASSEISANAEIIDSELADNSFVDVNAKIVNRVDE